MRLLFSLLLMATLAACQTAPKKNWDVPLTLQTIGPAYADYALEKTDANKNQEITLVEWTNAGGTERAFALVDENKDGVVTRTELVRFGSNVRFFDTCKRALDVKNDNRMTPRKFRTSSGVRVLRIEF